MSMEVIDLGAFVKKCLSAHRPAARSKKHSLHYERPKSAVYVTADPTALQMAVDNLITNAIKYTIENGAISVTVRPAGRTAEIIVNDNGIGIARKDLPLLFQKFSRLNDPASKTVGGSGLGLYMAKYIIELHKGRLNVRSQHGKGTRFTIKLPATAEKTVK